MKFSVAIIQRQQGRTRKFEHEMIEMIVLTFVLRFQLKSQHVYGNRFSKSLMCFYLLLLKAADAVIIIQHIRERNGCTKSMGIEVMHRDIKAENILWAWGQQQVRQRRSISAHFILKIR